VTHSTPNHNAASDDVQLYGNLPGDRYQAVQSSWLDALRISWGHPGSNDLRHLRDHPKYWAKLPLENKSDLPSVSGIYAVMAEGYIYYIGRSKNIRNRWARHHRHRQAQSLFRGCIAYKAFPEADLARVEQDFIDRLDPVWNGTEVPSESEIFVPQAPRKGSAPWGLLGYLWFIFLWGAVAYVFYTDPAISFILVVGVWALRPKAIPKLLTAYAKLASAFIP